MKTYRKIIAILLAVGLVLPGAGLVTFAEEVENVHRLAGADRYKTAVAVSEETYKGTADAVVLAGGMAEVDALTGTLLAAAKNAPLLYTDQGELTAATKARITALGAKKVYVLGGEKAVSETVVETLKALNLTVERVSGKDRHATAVAVAEEAAFTKGHAFVVTDGVGTALVDALAVAPVSYRDNDPVFLTNKGTLSTATKAALAEYTSVTIIGGEAAVSAAVETELKAMTGLTVNRVKGTNRDNTAVAIAEEFFTAPTQAVLANGYAKSLVDALVGGYLGGMKNAPVLYTTKDALAATTSAYVEELDSVYLLGGTAVTSATLATTVGKLLEVDELKVVSVSAINAKKLEVKFNKEVLKSDAEDAFKYTIVGAGFANPKLQDDGKTVILTSATAIPQDTTFVVTVDEISSKADVSEKSPKYTTTLKFSDLVRPALKGVTYPMPGLTEVNFTEELSDIGVVKVYDGLTDVTATVYTTPHTDGESKISLITTLNKEYRVVITGAKDQSGNLIAAPIEVVVKNTKDDQVKPTVLSVSTQGIDTVKIQFSEAVAASGSPEQYVTIKVNGIPATGTMTQTFDSKTNTVTVSGIAGINNGDVKSISVEAYKDLVGNPGDAFTKVVAFTTAAPAVQKTEVVKDGTDVYAVVTFDKAVDTTGINTGDTFTATYVTADKVSKTTTLTATNDAANKAIKLLLTGEEAGSYTVKFSAGKITDGTTANTKDVVVTFDLGTASDTTKPAVLNVYMVGDTLPDSLGTVGAGEVFVKYSKTMSAAALNSNNYTVDGSRVFENAIFVGDKTLVKLSVKEGSIAISGDRNFGISSSVTAENGVALPTYTDVETFAENVKPYLTTAKVVNGNTLELTFSENLGTTGLGTLTNDFEVLVNNAKNVVAGIVDTNPGDNVLELTLTDVLTAEQLLTGTITVKTLDTADISDVAGNTLVSGTLVNVAK